MTETKTPWLKFYGDVPEHIEYPETTLYETIRGTATTHPDRIAYEFMGRNTDYKTFLNKVDRFAAALHGLGVGERDSVLICLPNCPQALAAFYGVSKLGGIATMIHPMSAKDEIAFYLRNSKSRVAVTLDVFVGNFIEVKKDTPLEKLIVTSVKDELGALKGIGYALTLGRKVPPVPEDDCIVRWKDVNASVKSFDVPKSTVGAREGAVILYSGGTTGKTKGILLSSYNMNATAFQTIAMSECYDESSEEIVVLSVMPMFHGFGLCIGVHMFLAKGGKCILVPKFTPDTYAELIVKKRPNFIAGVPTLYEHMIRSKCLENADLSCLQGVFSGGDTLTMELREKMDTFLKEHNSSTTLREGYGTTECVTASCLTPKSHFRPRSIGIPFSDTYYKIVGLGTTDELPYGEDGEICISGPSVMMKYVDEPEETANVLKMHDDGKLWLHTGDIGMMDEDGFIYFKQRFKRMIISSGYNIYPSQIESVIDKHPDVYMSCVIGIHDEMRYQVVKAFVVLKSGIEETDATIRSIMEHCKKSISKYALPREIEFIPELPKTKVGKVAYTELEAREKTKTNAVSADHGKK